jgi:hypothetical protein
VLAGDLLVHDLAEEVDGVDHLRVAQGVDDAVPLSLRLHQASASQDGQVR